MSPLSLLTFLKSILPDISTATPALLWLVKAGSFTFNIFISLNLKYVSYILNFFLSNLDNVCLLSGLFNTFTVNVIIHMTQLTTAIFHCGCFLHILSIFCSSILPLLFSFCNGWICVLVVVQGLTIFILNIRIYIYIDLIPEIQEVYSSIAPFTPHLFTLLLL